MKKLLTLLSVLALCCVIATLCACNKDDDSNNQSEVVTVSGVGTNVWHVSEEFIAIVEVTVKDGVIEKVVLKPSSYVWTGSDAFHGWSEDIQNSYLNQFVGLTVEQILAMDVRGPVDVNNHYDGGSITSDDVHVVTGASASSVTIAMAVRNAVEKLVQNQ